nr:hypothetical protein GCM10020093_056890 [Planobispora longispora]
MSLLLLAIMTVAAVISPVLVAAVAIPVAILLRAADIAQPGLNTRLGVGRPAVGDVFRVFSHPGALLKSIGATVALVPYALILGLPVTLLLAVLVPAMPEANALAWGRRSRCGRSAPDPVWKHRDDKCDVLWHHCFLPGRGRGDGRGAGGGGRADGLPRHGHRG